jgi:selenoprotein S
MSSDDLKNQDPEIISGLGRLLANYGWYVVCVLIGLYVLWTRFLKETLNKWKEGRVGGQASASSPEEARKQREALLEARLRMQEKYNEVAKVELERRAEREKQLEEEKRRQKIEQWERLQEGKGYFSKTRIQETNDGRSDADSKRLKPKDSSRSLRDNDFNPLTGTSSGPSCGYRPGRRGPAAGGGG